MYHWRERKESVAYSIHSKSYASDIAKNVKKSYLKRNHIPGRVEYISGINQYRIVYDVVDNPLVSIIIPSKDHPKILKIVDILLIVILCVWIHYSISNLL